MRRISALVIAIVSAGALVTAAFFVFRPSAGDAEQPAYLPDPDVAAAEGSSIDASSASILREFEEPKGVVRWVVVEYESSLGPCLDVYGEAVSGGDWAEVGDCGEGAGPFAWAVGGVELGGEWYDVVDGRAPQGASRMRITLGDGTVHEADVVKGIYILVDTGARLDFDVTKIEAVASNGDVIAAVQPPSIAEAREAQPTPAASVQGS